ncbi:PPK2 family polyphosphate kinase [Actinomyces radicidentis]|uniref:PPK2 family polyphosphate kinase n=1 Tax=Actinomyces radicidentis TaxID=111015 RepID=UPI001B802AD3|nr:PPK2 family polyphosphate kinase [Actinomyces radicidentis]
MGRNKNKKDSAEATVNADLWSEDPREALRVGPDFHLASIDRASTPGWDGDEDDAVAYQTAIAPLLATLQERLFAASKEGSTKRVLIVAQGLDTAGKGGIARHVIGLVGPQGVELTAFKAPTEEEKEHDFLWRIRKAVPDAGYIGYFDRSHYEDILVPGANGQLDDAAFDERVEQIRAFEHELVQSGTAIIKIALMVSYEEQGLRLLERVDRPDKHWKYSTNDMSVRGQWFDYQAIYQRMLTATSFDEAPWHLVPADNKWYSRVAVTEMLLRTLADLDIPWPEGKFDVDAERERVRATISDEALASYDKKLTAKLAKVSGRIAAVDEAAKEIQAEGEDDAPGSADSLAKAPVGAASRKSAKAKGSEPKAPRSSKRTKSAKGSKDSAAGAGAAASRKPGKKAAK